MTDDRRQNKRFEIISDYYYLLGSEDEKVECTLNNISATGACIDTQSGLKIDDILFLHIRGKKDITIKSKAVWKIDNQYGLLFLLDTSKEFENVAYVMNYII